MSIFTESAKALAAAWKSAHDAAGGQTAGFWRQTVHKTPDMVNAALGLATADPQGKVETYALANASTAVTHWGSSSTSYDRAQIRQLVHKARDFYMAPNDVTKWPEWPEPPSGGGDFSFTANMVEQTGDGAFWTPTGTPAEFSPNTFEGEQIHDLSFNSDKYGQEDGLYIEFIGNQPGGYGALDVWIDGIGPERASWDSSGYATSGTLGSSQGEWSTAARAYVPGDVPFSITGVAAVSAFQTGPHEHADSGLKFWLLGRKNKYEIGFNLDNDDEPDLWIKSSALAKTKKIPAEAKAYVKEKAKELAEARKAR